MRCGGDDGILSGLSHTNVNRNAKRLSVNRLLHEVDKKNHLIHADVNERTRSKDRESAVS